MPAAFGVEVACVVVVCSVAPPGAAGAAPPEPGAVPRVLGVAPRVLGVAPRVPGVVLLPSGPGLVAAAPLPAGSGLVAVASISQTAPTVDRSAQPSGQQHGTRRVRRPRERRLVHSRSLTSDPVDSSDAVVDWSDTTLDPSDAVVDWSDTTLDSSDAVVD